MHDGKLGAFPSYHCPVLRVVELILAIEALVPLVMSLFHVLRGPRGPYDMCGELRGGGKGVMKLDEAGNFPAHAATDRTPPQVKKISTTEPNLRGVPGRSKICSTGSYRSQQVYVHKTVTG